MIPEKIVNLIQAIIEKTNSKKATWGKTSRENEFKLHFQNGAITTDWWSNDRSDEFIDIAIYNSFGDRIDSYEAMKGDEDYSTISELHNVAKRDFYKVEETIENLFKEAKNDKNIGKREVEGDLPF